MKFGIVVFPGSNCDADCLYALRNVIRADAEMIWHKEEKISGFDCLVIPGGFSYGDYLRTGAIARFSPVMKEVKRFADAGGLVFGICNGFQILLEAGLLPGAMLRNTGLRFLSRFVHVRVENTATPFTGSLARGEVLKIPIAHFEGNYYAEDSVLGELERENQVVLRYCTEAGEVVPEANPNGSRNAVAGIVNRGRNVFAMMPHPERCCEAILGSTDGRRLFDSVVDSVARGASPGASSRAGAVRGEGSHD
jgi:phosphoribosylformylglycinamidine synthase I